jgi:hypothetical protein
MSPASSEARRMVAAVVGRTPACVRASARRAGRVSSRFVSSTAPRRTSGTAHRRCRCRSGPISRRRIGRSRTRPIGAQGRVLHAAPSGTPDFRDVRERGPDPRAVGRPVELGRRAEGRRCAVVGFRVPLGLRRGRVSYGNRTETRPTPEPVACRFAPAIRATSDPRRPKAIGTRFSNTCCSIFAIQSPAGGPPACRAACGRDGASSWCCDSRPVAHRSDPGGPPTNARSQVGLVTAQRGASVRGLDSRRSAAVLTRCFSGRMVWRSTERRPRVP